LRPLLKALTATMWPFSILQVLLFGGMTFYLSILKMYFTFSVTKY